MNQPKAIGAPGSDLMDLRTSLPSEALRSRRNNIRVLAEIAGLSGFVAEKIPQVAPRVLEYADAAVSLVADGADYFAARVHDAGKGAIEVFDAKEQANAAGELPPDGGRLICTVGAGQYEPGVAVGRSYHDPPLRAPVGRRRCRVLRQDESQRAGEELDGGVVVVDNQ